MLLKRQKNIFVNMVWAVFKSFEVYILKSLKKKATNIFNHWNRTNKRKCDFFVKIARVTHSLTRRQFFSVIKKTAHLNRTSGDVPWTNKLKIITFNQFLFVEKQDLLFGVTAVLSLFQPADIQLKGILQLNVNLGIIPDVSRAPETIF